jgi:hypothetical protein
MERPQQRGARARRKSIAWTTAGIRLEGACAPHRLLTSRYAYLSTTVPHPRDEPTPAVAG